MIKEQYGSIFKEKLLLKVESFFIHLSHSFSPSLLPALLTSFVPQIDSPSFAVKKRADLQQRTVKQEKTRHNQTRQKTS